MDEAIGQPNPSGTSVVKHLLDAMASTRGGPNQSAGGGGGGSAMVPLADNAVDKATVQNAAFKAMEAVVRGVDLNTRDLPAPQQRHQIPDVRLPLVASKL